MVRQQTTNGRHVGRFDEHWIFGAPQHEKPPNAQKQQRRREQRGDGRNREPRSDHRVGRDGPNGRHRADSGIPQLARVT